MRGPLKATQFHHGVSSAVLPASHLMGVFFSWKWLVRLSKNDSSWRTVRLPDFLGTIVAVDLGCVSCLWCCSVTASQNVQSVRRARAFGSDARALLVGHSLSGGKPHPTLPCCRQSEAGVLLRKQRAAGARDEWTTA